MRQATHFLISLVIVLNTNLALAEQPDASASPASTILLVDSERVASEATALQTLYQEVDQAMLRQAVAHNRALDLLENEFAPVRDGRAELPAEAYQLALKEFNSAADQLVAALEEAEAGISTAAESSLSKFNAVRIDDEAELLAKYGASRFVDRAATLYVRPDSGYDKTDELIATINARLPSLMLERPAE